MGIVQSLIARHHESKQKRADVEQFRNALIQAVSDGLLTPEEMSELDALRAESGLTPGDLGAIRASAYAAALAAARSDGRVTEGEEAELSRIQRYLGLADTEIAPSKAELARLRLLSNVQDGNLPVLQVAGLVTQRDEQVHWSEPSRLLEEKVLRRRYEGGSSGVSFRIAKGVTYRVGAQRGHLVSETGIVPVSTGELLVTDRRIVFRGDAKSFAAKYDKLLDIQLFSDGLRFSEAGKSKPRIITYLQSGNQDIVGAILTQAVNRYGAA